MCKCSVSQPLLNPICLRTVLVVSFKSLNDPTSINTHIIKQNYIL
jgi:hypothetical protein